jgi:hypothetical protein
MTKFRLVFGLTLILGALNSCSDPSGPEGAARVRVLLTDAPSDYIASAEVHISRVYLQGGGEENAPRVDLFDDAEDPLVFDLLELRDGITADLTGDVEVEVGTYRQMRLVVDHATVTLAEGYTFSDGSTSKSLFIPSGAHSGIKIQLSEDIEAEPGETTTLVVDFDVDQNFVIQGNPNTPAGIHGILFTPVLHEKSRQTTS